MRVRFWGTRGSIAKPGPSTARYGGNTSCVEVRTDAGTLIVIDCGTGSHGLGQELCAGNDGGRRGHILISHTHWDHIQGIPFFAPLFVPGNEWDVYGPKGLSGSIRETLAGQMEHTYFPVTLEKFAATIRYHDLVEGVFAIDDVRITARYLHHPALTLGYRLEADGASAVYCCDHEPHAPALASGEGEIVGHDRRYAEFVAGADLVIHDAQYTAKDFPAKIGWGHSSAEFAVRICLEAGVRKVALTHHDPLRDDAAVDQILAGMRARVRASAADLEVVAAAEGETILLAGNPDAPAPVREGFAARSALSPEALQGAVVVRVDDAGIRKILEQAIAGEGLSAKIVADEAALLRAAREQRPLLVVVQHHPPGMDSLAITDAIRDQEGAEEVQVPVAVVTTTEDLARRASDAPTDWLVKPFSVSYARARIRAWALRSAIRWVRARLPVDEASRVGALRELDVLDTPPEDRFDRLTRLAAAAFDVPIALVSLVDADRQWFKSCYGLDVSETSRDEAFCAHVVHQHADMVVPDTLQDGRFADNPLVTDGPRIRFYAGAPLMLDGGACIGTFCLIDVRPRMLDPGQLALLHDLRDLALAELVERGAGQ